MMIARQMSFKLDNNDEEEKNDNDYDNNGDDYLLVQIIFWKARVVGLATRLMALGWGEELILEREKKEGRLNGPENDSDASNR